MEVVCDGQASHAFALAQVLPGPGEGRPPQPLDDPLTYGRALFAALFPHTSLARITLDAGPARILLIVPEPETQVVLSRGNTYMAHRAFSFWTTPFARGLPAEQRVLALALSSGLHVLAVPSNPLAEGLPALDIDGEWRRLQADWADAPSQQSQKQGLSPLLPRIIRKGAPEMAET